MFKKSRVASAVLTALGGTALLMLAPGVVVAQTASPQAAAAETVTVTGSRIKRTELASAPIAEVAAEEFRLSGATRVEDLLNTLPQLSSDFDSFTVNPTTGYATIDLRGLGSARTLVLVNGQRLQPGGIRSEARDINQIPAALIKRVDILTGGASAVYGADAMSGVVNFILDTEFEGFSGTVGWSGYRHKNENSYLRERMDRRGFSYPTGTSGPDGESQNVDLALGSSFADGKGHAMAYFTWRQNDELRQGARDYSSCALNGIGTACGGSATAPAPNFQLFGTRADGTAVSGWTALVPDPTPGGRRWQPVRSFTDPAGAYSVYNYAPINHYQRPDERWTFGSSVKYEVNSNFRPFLETMFSNTNTSVQIAESGVFFNNTGGYQCSDPLLTTLCADLGLDPSQPVDIYVGKRNSEGGPRVSQIESNSFRAVAGFEGDLFGGWSYNVSYLYGRNSSNEANINDFLTDRVDAAIRSGEYDVFTWNGVTAAQAAGLSGTGMRQGRTTLESVNAFVTGDLPLKLPTARIPVSVVLGAESRVEKYRVDADANMQTGNFSGLGGPRTPVDGKVSVREVFMEAQVPIFAGAGLLKSLDADVGYRSSDYNLSGNVNTFKVGGNASFGPVRVRAGFNRAIRAANTSDLFTQRSIGLWSGSDPCAGATPEFTREQCARTGVTAAQYGNVAANPAGQYNQFIGGTATLRPEEGDTITLGLVINPMRNVSVTFDYWDIEIEDQLGTIGASNVLRGCGLTGLALLCDRVNRSAANGDLWRGSDLATSGYVENLNDNFGRRKFTGVDLGVNATFDVFGGRLSTALTGTWLLEATIDPVTAAPSLAYDCAGVISASCQAPEWKHTASLRFSKDWWTVGARWRHVGELKYRNNDGSVPTFNASTTDRLLQANGFKLDAYNYLDISGSVTIGKATTLTAGINNVLDKEPPMVGTNLTLNANSIGGYDQLGQYIFATLNVRF